MQVGTPTLYRKCTPVIDTVYQIESDRSPIEAIVDAVATASEENPLESTPLYDYVDPDAINELFTHDNAESTTLLLGFCIDDWTVFVNSDGKIRVCDGTQTIDPEPIFHGFMH